MSTNPRPNVDYLKAIHQRPDVEYLKNVPVEVFCEFWNYLGCVPTSYIKVAIKFQKVKQNICNCAMCIIVDTLDFDASILLKMKKLRQVQVHSTTRWTKKNVTLGHTLTKLYQNGVDIQFKAKITPKTLVDGELFSLIPIVVPTYTYKEVEELVYMLLNSPRSGLHKCIACIIAYKPKLADRIRALVSHATAVEEIKPKPDRSKIKLLENTHKCVFA
jgi:hypothetical protein